MNSYPLISIIIPIYNVEKYLRECLDSVLAQTYKHLEIILIDDGSIDASGTICDEYASKDKRIKVIHQTNQGVSAARNAGLETAQGEYIGFVDSDDYIKPDMYEYLHKLISKDDADMAMCNICESKTFRSASPIREAYHLISFEGIFNWSDWMYLVNKLFNKRAIQSVNMNINCSCGEDEQFIFEILKNNGEIALGKEAKYHYRANPSSATHVFKPSHLRELEFRDRNLQYAKEHNLTQFCQLEFTRRAYHISRWLQQLMTVTPVDDKSINFLISYIRRNWNIFFFQTNITLKTRCFLALCGINFTLTKCIYKFFKKNERK